MGSRSHRLVNVIQEVTKVFFLVKHCKNMADLTLCVRHHLERYYEYLLAFYFKYKYFVLIDHILSETTCLFCFCVLFLNMYPKIKFTAKLWSDLCNIYSKVIFFSDVFVWEIIFTFLCWIWIINVSQQYCENFRKIEQAELVENLPPSTYPTDFYIICLHFYYGKTWKYLIFFRNKWLEKNFLCTGSYNKWFCIKSWQKFANLLLLCKAPSKKRLSERCR